MKDNHNHKQFKENDFYQKEIGLRLNIARWIYFARSLLLSLAAAAAKNRTHLPSTVSRNCCWPDLTHSTVSDNLLCRNSSTQIDWPSVESLKQSKQPLREAGPSREKNTKESL
jgi:hypothetical protein